MKKKLTALLLALALLVSLSACGASGSSGMAERKMTAAAPMTEAAEDGYYYDSADTAEEAALDTEANGAAKAAGDSGEGQQSAYQNAKVKLIRRASLRLETKEFDAAVQGLERLVDELGGYVEESNLNQGGYGSTYRSASYTVRVPAQKYGDFLSRMSSEEHCHLTGKDESTEDVGQAYFDTETRLKTLRTKLDRLQTLLEQAKHMDDIITLEDAITSTEYEIERYTSTLNRYDSLIGYATFQVSIEQVVTISDTDTISFSQRLGNSFLGGLEDFLDGVQELLIWLAGHVMNLAVLVLLILLARWILRRRREKREQRLRDQGIDPKAVKRSGWKPMGGRKVPPMPFAPPKGVQQTGDAEQPGDTSPAPAEPEAPKDGETPQESSSTTSDE